VVMKPDGTFKAFRFNGVLDGYNERGSILATTNGQVWLVLAKGNGVFVFNYNNTIDDESDDTYRRAHQYQSQRGG
jgi:hypothetical protein